MSLLSENLCGGNTGAVMPPIFERARDGKRMPGEETLAVGIAVNWW